MNSISLAHHIIEAEHRSAFRFQKLLEQIPVPLCHVNRDGRLVFINDYFQQVFGYTLEDVPTLEMWWQYAYPDLAYRAWVLATWDEVVKEASSSKKMIRPVIYKVTTKNGSIRHMVISGITLGDDYLATFTDVTETQEQQQLLMFSNQILQQVSQGNDLSDVLTSICKAIEAINPEIRCSILLIDPAEQRAHHGAAPSLPTAYALAIDGIEIGPSVGSCGTAAYRKETVFSPDIQQDPLWFNFKELAALYELAACWSSPIFSSTGQVIGTFGIYWSSPHPRITPLLKRYVETTTFVANIAIENHLRKKDQLLATEKLRQAASVFEYTHEGIFITDETGTILNVNRAFTAITGYDKNEIIGQKPSILKSGRHEEAFYQSMWQSLNTTGHWSGEIWNRRKDGQVFPEKLTISAVKDHANRTNSYVGLFADITALKEQEKKLEHMAHYDVLTRLPNRVLLANRIRQAISYTHGTSSILAVVYLDLDGFKSVNDTYGHDVGDDLLKALGKRMQQVLRSGDTLARIGGDEFVALLTNLPHNNACIPVVERLLQAASAPVFINDHTLNVSASIGVCFFPQAKDDHTEAEQLLRQADQAMYQAKQTGRNRYFLFES